MRNHDREMQLISEDLVDINRRILIELQELNQHLRDQKHERMQLARPSGIVAPSSNGHLPPGHTNSFGPG
jgi:hypothetical protein